MGRGETADRGTPRVPPALDYRVLRGVALPAFRGLLDFEVAGAGNVPVAGGAVVAAVHRSHADVPLLAAACSRPVHFMAKAELFDIPVLGRWFRRLGAFPVERGRPDRVALVDASRVLSGGDVLGIFPEGGFGRGLSVGPLQRGAVWLALRHGVPLIPAVAGGAERLLPPDSWRVRPTSVRVVFGEPLEPAARRGRAAVDAATVELRDRLQALYEEAPP